ncbi:MAG: hypothetical protein ACREOG_05840 [Gemmatimonadaceae bacterium]
MATALRSSLGTLALALAVTGQLAAQGAPPRGGTRVKLSAVIAAFLADSGVRTRGLAWTTGNDLGIKWESAAPKANPDQGALQRGLALVRTGTFTGTVGDSVALPMTITVSGTTIGLASVAIEIPSMEVTYSGGGGFFLTREMVETTLKNEGLTLQPLKCSREKEGASYGNLVDAVKAPGKTASGLWWFWQSPQQQSTLALTILYRRAEMAQVECQG